MKNESTRRNFLGTSLGATLALLASKGFYVAEVKAQDGPSISIVGLTSDGSDALFPPHVHGFTATVNLQTGEFSGVTTSVVPTGKDAVGPHAHAIKDMVDPFDFDALAETSAEYVHTHQVRSN